MVTLHIIGLFHTITSDVYSHCAFTMKVLRFSKMMKMYGYKVIEYSNGDSESEAIHVQILTKEELDGILGQKGDGDFVGSSAIMGSAVWTTFDERLIPSMQKYVCDGDIICYPFGNSHPALGSVFPSCFHVETGIGYPGSFCHHRIFESYAYMHYTYGGEQSMGKNYNWVIPNYYDIDEWDVNTEVGSYILYFGRITPCKGMLTVVEIARRLDSLGDHVPRKIVVCGQGDPTPYIHPNIEYRPPIHGRARSALLGGAYCMLMPTVFIEPFGGAGVEGQLCGTPLLASNYGAFTETVIDGISGFRCNTLHDWLVSLEKVPFLDRGLLAKIARSTYSLERCGEMYDKVFRDICNLRYDGWYANCPPTNETHTLHNSAGDDDGSDGRRSVVL